MAPGSFDTLAQIVDRVLCADSLIAGQHGILAPRSALGVGASWFSEMECVIRPPSGDAESALGRLWVRVRYFRLRRTGGATEWTPHSVDVDSIDLRRRLTPHEVPLAGIDVASNLVVETEPLDRFVKLRVRLENREPWNVRFAVDRAALLGRSLAAVHLLAAIDSGSFVSMLHPEPVEKTAVARCWNDHVWPVLIGDARRRNVTLVSPVPLDDFPDASASTPGAGAGDPRESDDPLDGARLPPRRTTRGAGPARRLADFLTPPGAPVDEPFVVVGARRVERGSHVCLRLASGGDATVAFLGGRAATVAAIHRDIDDRIYVAVTMDRAAPLPPPLDKTLYFDPTEIEPIAQNVSRTTPAPSAVAAEPPATIVSVRPVAVG